MVNITTLINSSDTSPEEARTKIKVAEKLTDTKNNQKKALRTGEVDKFRVLGIKIFALEDRLKNT